MASRKEKIDFALGMLFFGSSLSFSLVDSSVFKTFVNLLDPNYSIPCRQTLSTTILRKVHARVATCLRPIKDLEKATLIIDGWKNCASNSKTVTTIMKLSSNEEIFLKSYDFSSLSEDHINLLEVVEDSVLLAQRRYNVVINAYISDHAANVLKTGRESGLIVTTCKAHAGNLYVGDVHDKSLYSKVHVIMVCFRNVHLQEQVHTMGGKRIYLAGDTRWKVFRLKV